MTLINSYILFIMFCNIYTQEMQYASVLFNGRMVATTRPADIASPLRGSK